MEPLIVVRIGKVYGPYTGRRFASRSETDIEHMVARSEAHDSGLCAATAETRRRFVRDLLNLTLAGPRVNRYQKRAHDAAEWLPPENQCWFAARVVAVRCKYGLTIDRREADALERALSSCASTEMVIRECAESAEPPASRLSESEGDPLELYDDNGNMRRLWTDEAQRSSYGGDKSMRSRDASSNRSPSERSAPRNSTNSS